MRRSRSVLATAGAHARTRTKRSVVAVTAAAGFAWKITQARIAQRKAAMSDWQGGPLVCQRVLAPLPMSKRQNREASRQVC